MPMIETATLLTRRVEGTDISDHAWANGPPHQTAKLSEWEAGKAVAETTTVIVVVVAAAATAGNKLQWQ